MLLANKVIGFGLTGSHCTMSKIIPVMKKLIQQQARVIPVVSPAVAHHDTRFGTAEGWLSLIENITGRPPLQTIVEVEPIGPEKKLDLMLIAPCTGNTLAKLASGITDTPVLMAAKAQLRNQRPVVISIASNDVLGMNLKNLAIVLNSKHIFLVPIYQDQPYEKPGSLTSRVDCIIPTMESALRGYQYQPVLYSRKAE